MKKHQDENEKSTQKENKKEKNFDLTNIICSAIKVPGVKVVREDFLLGQFKDLSLEEKQEILEKGPMQAGISREEIKKKAKRILKERTAISTSASFLAGIPGGWAMVATIPADILQFYGVALRMAQEIAYLYGEADMWCDDTPDADKVTNQLILYCGVMLGASGASQAVRVMSSALAKQAMKKLPQMALTKTFYYPVIKAILKFFGVSVTKSTFAKGVSKVVPVVGGVVSGGITLASMIPMGNRLIKVLDKAHFDYTEKDFEADFNDITEICKKDKKEKDETENNTIVADTGFINEKEEITEIGAEQTAEMDSAEQKAFEKIEKAKKMLDSGIITKKEFAKIKARIIKEI